MQGKREENGWLENIAQGLAVSMPKDRMGSSIVYSLVRLSKILVSGTPVSGAARFDTVVRRKGL
jgi:hypothetical protein